MLYSASFLTMSFASLCTICSIGAFFLFPLFIAEHGGSKLDIGFIMGIFGLSSVLCRPWISEMIDRVGRKGSYTIGCLISSSLPLAYLLLHGDLTHFYIPLLLIRILHGVGAAICFISSFTYIVDNIPAGRLNEGIGMFGITGLAGFAIGPMIGEVIILKFGFSAFFLTASGLATLGLLAHLPLPESYAHASIESSQSFFSVLIRRKIFVMVLLVFLFGFGISATGNFVVPFAKEQHITFISLYYVCYSSAAVFTRLFGGRLADRVGEDRIIPRAMILTGAGIFVLIFLGASPILVLAGLMTGCGHGFLYPCLNALAVRNEPVNIRGKVIGIFTGGLDAGLFIGAIILGYIGEWAGFQALFLAGGLAFLVGLGVYKLWPQTPPAFFRSPQDTEGVEEYEKPL